jgi:hypothetical protein
MPTIDDVRKRREQMFTAYQADVPYGADLNEESLRISELHFKYLQMLTIARRWEREVRTERRALRRSLFEWYRGQLNFKHVELSKLKRGPCEFVPNQKDIEFYVDSDAGLIEVSNLASEIEEWRSDIETILDAIKGRQFHLRNAIEYLKLKAQVS